MTVPATNESRPAAPRTGPAPQPPRTGALSGGSPRLALLFLAPALLLLALFLV
jgi:hypothetical protein